MIARQPLLVSFCSQADEDHVELWLIRDLRAVATPAPRLYEVIVSAERLFRSDPAFSSEELPISEEFWVFHETEHPNWFAAGIDLAYVYVYVGGGSFQCLAQVLGLACVVGVETIHLPDYVMKDVAVWREAKHYTASWPLEEAFERRPQPGR